MYTHALEIGDGAAYDGLGDQVALGAEALPQDIPAPDIEPDWDSLMPSITFGWSDVVIPPPGDPAASDVMYQTQSLSASDKALAWVESNWLLVAAGLGGVMLFAFASSGGGR